MLFNDYPCMKKSILYLHDDEIQNYNYARAHPMKPLRVSMTYSLMINYELFHHMDILKPTKASYNDLLDFHSSDYIDFLSSISGELTSEMVNDINKFNVKDDCPIFPGLFDYCRSTAGASILGAKKINTKEYHTVINWSGGLHHAKRSEASGFCYVNDIVLGILELLKVHDRLLYIDIDVHHGDGVEEAFYLTDRVMTLSFHKYGDFFPGTGRLDDKGLEKGENYAVNVPLKDGMDDESYEMIFKPIVERIMNVFKPSAVVLQCGADCLSGDKLGCFNLTEKGHGMCVEYVKSFNLPMMVLGGGGYTIENVARAWTYDTGIVCGIKLNEDIPYNEFMDYYCPTYKLKIEKQNSCNMNTPEDLNSIISVIYENLKNIKTAPSLQITKNYNYIVDNESNDELIYEKAMNDE